MEGWDGDCDYGDDDTRALKKQLQDIQLAKCLEGMEAGRKRRQAELRKQIKKAGHKPCR